MTVPALWTKHRPVALAIAAEFRIPGQDADDTRQDALVALWEAASVYDMSKGPFPPFARLVVTRRLTDRLKAETREKRHATLVELPDVPAPDTSEGRARLQNLVAVLPSLTVSERKAVAAQLDGSYRSADRRQENALQSARRKLRAA